jgi:hypothetical protein
MFYTSCLLTPVYTICQIFSDIIRVPCNIMPCRAISSHFSAYVHYTHFFRASGFEKITIHLLHCLFVCENYMHYIFFNIRFLLFIQYN